MKTCEKCGADRTWIPKDRRFYCYPCKRAKLRKYGLAEIDGRYLTTKSPDTIEGWERYVERGIVKWRPAVGAVY